MSEFLPPRTPEFLERATKLARILDEKFDGFGTLIEDSAIDHAAVILETIEEKGCQLIFADETATLAEAPQ